MIFVAGVIKWVTDPRNRTLLLFIFIALLIGLFFYQRSRTQKFKYKFEEQVKETTRLTNNWEASRDTLKIYMTKDSIQTGEISGYQLTVEELQTEYKDLFNLYRIEKNKPPKVIIEYRPVLAEDISDIPTQVIGDSLIVFKDSVNYGDSNWRVIEAKIPYELIYRIKPDSMNGYAFIRALRYAFELKEEGIKDAFVVIYEDGNRVNYKEIENLDSVIYHVQIYSSQEDISRREISEMFNIDIDYIYKLYEDGTFKYLTGIFVPKNNTIISKDESLTFAELQTKSANAKLSIGMTLGTALYKDPKTQEIMIQVKSSYPGITFEDVRGAEVMATIKSNKKVARSFRKEWGVGFNLGLGMYPVAVNNNFKVKFGPVIAVGINYTPRWLQFGPSQKGKNTISSFIDGE